MKTIDDLLKGCEHDGSYIPVSECKRLMEEYAQERTKDSYPKEFCIWCNGNIVINERDRVFEYLWDDDLVTFYTFDAMFIYWKEQIKK